MKISRTKNQGQDEKDTDSWVHGEADHTVEQSLAQRTNQCEGIADEIEAPKLFRRRQHVSHAQCVRRESFTFVACGSKCRTPATTA